jgi:hypothetical protein
MTGSPDAIEVNHTHTILQKPFGAQAVLDALGKALNHASLEETSAGLCPARSHQPHEITSGSVFATTSSNVRLPR